MRILHIGDYHFKPKANNYEQSLMVEKMIESLKGKPKIDLLLFSGDLVNSGSDYLDFKLAHESLFEKICQALDIPNSQIVVCPGNHDINRNENIKAIVNYYDEKIISSDLLYDEYNKKTNEFSMSLKPSDNYLKYIKEYFENDFFEFHELYSISKKIISDKNVAIVTLNSAWLSNGFRDDINLLMLPPEILKNIILKIKDADCKILLLHHPLSYFKEFNSIELEDLIHKEFYIILSGHIHREQICTNFAGHNGIFSNTTQATLTFDREGEIGYSIINFDFENRGEIKVERSSYLKKEHGFIDLQSVLVHVPIDEEKAYQNRLRNKIISKFDIELNNSNELLLEYDEEKGGNFLDYFTSPVLSTNSGTDNAGSDKHGLFNFETLFSDDKNYLIFGNDKSGKTTLLKRLQLFYLKKFSLLGKVPFYVDYKDLEAKESNIDIRKMFRNYYEISNAESENLINNNQIILLIDNLNTSSAVNEFVISFLETHKNVQFIICSDFIASRVYFEELDHLEYIRIYFKDLTRKEIRLFSEKYNTVKEFKQEEVLEKINKMLLQLQLPVNYWTVSLILLIYKKSNDDYNKNLFGILDLCVDEILQKKQLSLSKTSLSFDQYKEICSQIAYELLKKHKSDVYSASATVIITFINELIGNNVRIVGDAKEIFDYLLNVGLLKEKNSKYTFRLNGLFEYFLAYYINNNPEIKEEILENDSIYLGFKNELEIYSGLNRKDEDFLKSIYQKTRNVFDQLILNYGDAGTLDSTLMLKLGEVSEFAEKVKKLKVSSSLTYEMQDIVKDSVEPLDTASEVHLKEFIDANNITPEVLEKYLAIFSRVFKNCDNVNNTKLVYEIFEYLIEAYLNFGFYLIDEFANLGHAKDNMEVIEDENGEIKIGKGLLNTLANFIPILTQVLLHEGIAHSNMTKIILTHIEKYKQDYRKNQYKLFLLYFLLMDIDIKQCKKYIDEVFELITLSPLKVSTYFKLNYYLAFKAYKNKDLETFFKTKIREAQIRMDSKAVSGGGLNKQLSDKQKANIIRKNRNL